jgi:hypothetical protein
VDVEAEAVLVIVLELAETAEEKALQGLQEREAEAAVVLRNPIHQGAEDLEAKEKPLQVRMLQDHLEWQLATFSWFH